MNLSFARSEVGALFLGVLLGAIVCGDGQSNWYKGVQLITVYSIMALMFFVIPELSR
jgi:Ca2+:H+ antiporter